MRQALFPLLLPLLFLTSCTPTGTVQEEVPARDTTWVGELSITAGDTLFMDCPTGRKYKVTGPAMDTLYRRYRYFRTKPGQWMKTWLTGHLGTTQIHGHTDSALVAVTYMHLDGALRCDPLPRPALSGSFVARFQDPMGERVVRMDLFPDGEVTSITTLANGAQRAEEDGIWGMDSEEQVVVEWPHREHTMLFRVVDGDLVSQLPHATGAQVMERDGPADRMRGAFGRTARWLSATAAQAGHPMPAEEIRPGTRMSTLFPTPEGRAAVRAQAPDSLLLSDERLRREWDAVEEVRSVVVMMRLRERRER
ncbi:MAG TPA: hypothetical protein VGE21_14315 [Flavobacteriales bacterium]